MKRPVAARKVKSPLPDLSPRQADGVIILLLIAGLLVASGSFGYLSLASLLCVLCLFYASFIEPQFLITKRIAVPSTLPQTLRIAIAGDFHVGPYKGVPFVQRVVAHINALKPDLILLPGDFLYDHTSPVEPLTPLKDLRAPLGVFAVVGNHDAQYEIDRRGDLCPFLEQLGITMINTKAVTLTHEGKDFVLAGLDDVWEEADLETLMHSVPKHLPVLLLTHNPDTAVSPHSARASVIVSGHTHGGQVRLPFLGPLARIPTQIGNTFDRGSFHVAEETHLVITQGTGESGMRLRFFCPPEVVMLEIKK